MRARPPDRPLRARRRVASRGWALLGLALALLLAQGLGLLHQVAHGPHLAAPVPPGVAAGTPDDASQEPGGARHDARHDHRGGPFSVAQAAFDGHDEGGVECRLYDQLAHADGLVDTALTGALPAPSDRFAGPAPTPAPPSAPHHFEARGPPAAA